MPSLLDPRHNLREIIKQMLLLEHHLCDPQLRCPDCICKHIMLIEAYAEEGAQLDKTGSFIHPTYFMLAIQIENISVSCTS